MDAVDSNRRKTKSVRLTGFGLGCALLALVFATASGAKIGRLEEFETTLVASRLVPTNLAHLAATAVVILELVVAGSLIHPRARPTTLQMAALLFCVFAGYSAWRWLQDIPVPCNCFGVLFTIRPSVGILVNLALLGLTTCLLIVADRGMSRASSH